MSTKIISLQQKIFPWHSTSPVLKRLGIPPSKAVFFYVLGGIADTLLRKVQAEPDTHCISRKPAAEAAAKRNPAPTQAEAVHAAQGSADQGAVPILSLTYDYCCSNLKDGKLIDK